MPPTSTERNRLRRQRWYDILNHHKVAQGCADCGYDAHPVALHYDHEDPELKVACISTLANRLSPDIEANRERVFDEIRKCRVLCSNCHAVKTFEKQEFRNRVKRPGG